MKTNFAMLTMCLFLLCLFTTAKERGTSLTGESLTDLGQYSIIQSPDAMKIGNVALKTYEVNYSNNDSPILIGVIKTKKCKSFIVRAENFEIEYVCNNHVFGVKRMDKQYQTISPEVIDHMLDKYDFYTQRVITQYSKTEEELVALIASYFPSLIREDHLAEL